MPFQALNSGNSHPHLVQSTVTAYPLNAMELDPSDDVEFSVPVSIYNSSATLANLELVPAGAASDADAFFVKIAPYGFAPFRVRKMVYENSSWDGTLVAVY